MTPARTSPRTMAFVGSFVLFTALMAPIAAQQAAPPQAPAAPAAPGQGRGGPQSAPGRLAGGPSRSSHHVPPPRAAGAGRPRHRR